MEYKREKPGPRSVYSDTFRRKVVEEVLSGRIHVAGAARKYGIEHRSTVSSWLKWHAKNHDIAPKQVPMAEQESKAPDPIEQSELKALQQALKAAELKIAALETLIDVAEEQLKIDIRKKPGTRQSK